MLYKGYGINTIQDLKDFRVYIFLVLTDLKLTPFCTSVASRIAHNALGGPAIVTNNGWPPNALCAIELSMLVPFWFSEV